MPADRSKTKTEINDIAQHELIKMVGLGIGPETEFVRDFYALHMILKELDQDPNSPQYFARIAARIIERLIFEPNLVEFDDEYDLVSKLD